MKKNYLIFNLAILIASLLQTQSIFAQASANPNTNQPQVATGIFSRNLPWGGGSATRIFRYNVPASYDATKKYKLIVGLHGLQGDPVNYMTFFGPMTDGSEISPVNNTTIIVCPQATGTNTDFWTPVGDTGLISLAITDAMAQYNIDPEHIYLNGESLGARAALRYGLINYKRFRGLQLWVPAIQSMAEALNQTSFTYKFENAKYIPICMMIATNDGQLYQQTECYKQLYKAGGVVKLQTLYNYPHAPSPDPYTFNCLAYIDNSATSYQADDAGIHAILSPLGTECSTTITPKVVIQNIGTNALTSAVINYQVDNGTINTYNWTGNLGQLNKSTLSLPSISVSTGTHTFKAYTTMPNGNVDAMPANDDSTITFSSVTNGGAANLVMGFQGIKTFDADWRNPPGWRQAGTDSSFYWELDQNYGGFGKSIGCIHFDNAAPNNTGNKYQLITPDYDFTNSSAPGLKYDYAYAPITYGGQLKTDTLAVYYSLDCGATWMNLIKKGGVNLNTSGLTTYKTKENGDFFFPTGAQWKTETLSLTAVAGQANVMFAFEDIPGFGNMLFLDNINLTGVTGISTIFGESTVFDAYPNPTNGLLSVSFQAPEKNNYWLEVRDILGQIIYSESLNNFSGNYTKQIDLNQNAHGLYFLSISTAQQKIVKKIVVN